MANFQTIHFIQSLTSAEIRLAEDYLLKSAHLFNKSENAKELSLFNHIIKNKTKSISDNEIKKEIKTDYPSQLKINLLHKVLESLTLDRHIENSTLFDEIDIITFQLRKRLLVCKVLMKSLNQGKTETINEILSEIIRKSKEYELYDILLDALNTKKYFTGIRTGLSDFEKINSELSVYEFCYKAVLRAADNYYKIILNTDFIKIFSKSEKVKHLKNSIAIMQNDYKKTKSEQINYYLHIIRFGLYEQEKNYSEAIVECTKLISILKKNKAIFRNERIGFALTNRALYRTFMKDYSEAIKDAKKSQEYYLEDSFNHAKSKELEFYIYFYAGNYSEANKCLNSILSHSRIDTGEFRRSKYIYYRAFVFFAEREFKEALMLLNESLEIEKDKTRWNISLRILNIMIFMEMNKIDEAFASLESLRKYMERTGKTDEVSKRDVLIVKLLREMQKNGFEYDPQNTASSKMIKQLSEKDSDTSWEYFSSELIPFHEWLKKKFKIK